MKEKESSKKWLAIVIIIIIIAIIVCLVVFLPILIGQVKSNTDSDFIIDLQIGRTVAVLSLPTEFKQNRELVKISLVEAPFMNKDEIMIAIRDLENLFRDLENLFPAKVEWNSENRTIKVSIPPGIISKSQLVFTLTDKDFILQNGRAFVPMRSLATLLKASEIIWISETQGIRIIWYNN
jgi:hypothetical protein